MPVPEFKPKDGNGYGNGQFQNYYRPLLKATEAVLSYSAPWLGKEKTDE